MIDNILSKNKKFSDEKKACCPNYFSKHASTHNPHTFWLGCCDSRVSPEQITQSEIGELFVHRNVANLVQKTDSSLITSLHFALEGLDVQQIVICGHYGCAGVLCALQESQIAHVPNWIAGIKKTAQRYQQELEALSTLEQKHQRLVELSVLEQVHQIKQLDSYLEALHEKKKNIEVHGLIYDLSNGLLKKIT